MPSRRPPDPDSPEALVREAGRGDVHAFARIVRLHHEAMTRTALLVTLDPAMAAEATVEAWETAWSRMAGLADPEGLAGWLGSIAIDEALFLVRHAHTREIAAAGPARPPVDPDLAGVLAELSPEDRALLARRYLAGIEAPEPGRGTLAAVAAVDPLDAVRALRRTRREDRLARLSSLIAGTDVLATSPDAVAERARARLRTFVDVPVLPVHADQAASRARDETALERGRMVSVAVCAVVGMLVAAAPYLVRLAYHHG